MWFFGCGVVNFFIKTLIFTSPLRCNIRENNYQKVHILRIVLQKKCINKETLLVIKRGMFHQITGKKVGERNEKTIVR